MSQLKSVPRPAIRVSGRLRWIRCGSRSDIGRRPIRREDGPRTCRTPARERLTAGFRVEARPSSMSFEEPAELGSPATIANEPTRMPPDMEDRKSGVVRPKVNAATIVSTRTRNTRNHLGMSVAPRLASAELAPTARRRGGPAIDDCDEATHAVDTDAASALRHMMFEQHAECADAADCASIQPARASRPPSRRCLFAGAARVEVDPGRRVSRTPQAKSTTASTPTRAELPRTAPPIT